MKKFSTHRIGDVWRHKIYTPSLNMHPFILKYKCQRLRDPCLMVFFVVAKLNHFSDMCMVYGEWNNSKSGICIMYILHIKSHYTQLIWANASENSEREYLPSNPKIIWWDLLCEKLLKKCVHFKLEKWLQAFEHVNTNFLWSSFCKNDNNNNSQTTDSGGYSRKMKSNEWKARQVTT